MASQSLRNKQINVISSRKNHKNQIRKVINHNKFSVDFFIKYKRDAAYKLYYMLHIIDQVYIHTVDIVNKYIHLSCVVFHLFLVFFASQWQRKNKSSIVPHGTKQEHNKTWTLRVSIIQELTLYFAILRIPSNIFACWIITKTVVTKSITKY